MSFLCKQVAKARAVGVNSIVLFPKVPEALKVSTLVFYLHTYVAELYTETLFVFVRIRQGTRHTTIMVLCLEQSVFSKTSILIL